jgi:PelA/Pel-15E family pectate lyase
MIFLHYKFFGLIKLVALFTGTALSLTIAAQDVAADNMLLYQRSIGGWPKHINEVKIDYDKKLSPEEKVTLLKDHNRKDATIDNSATTKEIRYLLKAYKQSNNANYKNAAEKGIKYLLQMQYNNGGFPQYFPDSSSYRSQITFNDNAMINVMNVLWDVAEKKEEFSVVNKALIKPAEEAIAKGIDCILKTQIKVNGKLTAWCPQYDKNTLQPAKARAFELPAISASESAGIVSFLMKVKQPSLPIQQAVQSAMQWFGISKITGYKYVDINDERQPNGKDRVLQKDTASTVWARFYDIESNKPFFTGRDGVKKWNLVEIEHERRTGYAWYGTWPKKLIEKEYPAWVTKNGINDNARK